MEPLISIRILHPPHPFQPGEVLTCEYQLDAIKAEDVLAVEASVLWHTEGKGDDDMSVHYFERRTLADTPDGDLRALREFSTALPNSPLTYLGVTLKIQWRVRVRAFLRRGKEVFFERTFALGNVPPVRRLADQQTPAAARHEG
jgi:hypothetical protein